MRLRKSLTALIVIAVTVLGLLSFCHAGQSGFDGKKFYRSLSGRLGRKRSDYPKLNDYEFANFREVNTTGIVKGRLFRSSSPVSTWSERNLIADRAAENVGVKTFINLADSDKALREHGGYSGSYYSTQKVIALNLGMKYADKKFKKSLANGIHLMAVNEPPYLIHCSLGKDRGGFVCAVIECLMGATLQDIEEDYMRSFYNYFGITKGSEEYDFVLKNELFRFLSAAFGVESLEGVSLPDAAARYLFNIGVSPLDIKTLREKLGR